MALPNYEKLANDLKLKYDSSTNSYYTILGEIKIVIAKIEYTTGNTSPYSTTWNFKSPISFTKGLVYTTSISGNIYRNPQIRPSGSEIIGDTIPGVAISDIANYSNSFNILIIGY